MIKKIFVIVCILLLTVSCDISIKEESGIDNILYDTMENKRNLSFEGTELLFKNIEINDEEDTVPVKYIFIDLDGDKQNELAVEVKSNIGYFIILRYDKENDVVYGYRIDHRAFIDLKTDGTFYGSGGAEDSYYCKFKFKDGDYDMLQLAHSDTYKEVYELNGEKVSKEEVEEYAKEFNNKENAVWKDYEN